MFRFTIRDVVLAALLGPPLLALVWLVWRVGTDQDIPGGFLGWYLIMAFVALFPWIVGALLATALAWKLYVVARNASRRRSTDNRP